MKLNNLLKNWFTNHEISANWFVMIDNLQYDDLNPVPLPPSLLLLGTGLAALLGWRLRK